MFVKINFDKSLFEFKPCFVKILNNADSLPKFALFP
jgi:hypothetical protein